MKINGMTLAGLYVIVAKALASPASGDAAGPTPVEGTAIACQDKTEKQQITSNVSQPNTTVTVTCPAGFKLEPPIVGNATANVYLDVQCKQPGVLSSVCPGASVANETRTKDGETKVNVHFPQLPTTQQVVYLKCAKESDKECIAVIAVAPASPQGPQACAVPGKSVTLQVDQAGGKAQFACGGTLTLEPTDPTKAYADDCSKIEALKDMTRSDTSGGYSTLEVSKLRKKKLCYLCGQSGDPGKRTGKGDRCTIYVEVSGARRFSSSVFFAFTLPCLAAMLGFT